MCPYRHSCPYANRNVAGRECFKCKRRDINKEVLPYEEDSALTAGSAGE